MRNELDDMETRHKHTRELQCTYNRNMIHVVIDVAEWK